MSRNQKVETMFRSGNTLIINIIIIASNSNSNTGKKMWSQPFKISSVSRWIHGYVTANRTDQARFYGFHNSARASRVVRQSIADYTQDRDLSNITRTRGRGCPYRILSKTAVVRWDENRNYKSSVREWHAATMDCHHLLHF
jgi:hypothetical protein